MHCMCVLSDWFLLQKCIFTNSIKLIELCVLKLDHDWFPLLDLLAIVLNPMSRYPSYLLVAHFTFVLSITFYVTGPFIYNLYFS